MESETEYEQDFYDTCEENNYFSEMYKKFSCPEQFLHRSEKVYARGVTLDSAASSVWLNYSTDIDGSVVELKRVSGYCGIVRHISICPHDSGSMKYVKGLLKKHVDLERYSQSALSCFNNSVGIQLFYEEGWECWLGLIPLYQKSELSFTKEKIWQISYGVFVELRTRLQRVLCDYATQGLAMRSLVKNDMNDLRRLFILPCDSALMLSAVQLALNGLELQCFRPIVFCFRFGEKMTDGLDMSMFSKDMVEKVTVHAAVDISADCGINLMWSMSGLQQVVGTRGTLSTCLSFSDCGNFQSNLDGRLLDVKPELRRICLYPEKLKFIQIYADVPHRKPKSRFHPVSGIIAGGMCFHKPTADAFSGDATSYLSTLDSNWYLTRRSTCRIEVVCEFDFTRDLIFATDVIQLLSLDNLLQERPMLVPFPENTILYVREVGLWITKELHGLYDKFQKTGNIQATWYAFQLELASEKLLWGRPLCNISCKYSTNLGPGLLTSSRSTTDYLGFLALEPWSSCLCDEDSIPLYSIWTRSEMIGKCIIRAAGLHDHLEGSYPVIGRRLVFALLKNFFEIGKVAAMFCFEQFLVELKADEPRFKPIGSVTIKSLCDLLKVKRRMSPNMVYGHLCGLLEKAGVDLNEVLVAGLKELKLTHFPAFQTYDSHGNAVLSWSFKSNFWKLVSSGNSCTCTSTTLKTQSDLVKGDLEKRGLIFPSKLKMCQLHFRG